MKMNTLKFDTPRTPVDEGFEEEQIELDLPEGALDTGDDEPAIEVVDDTPEEDRGRKASAPPAEVTDEELEKYSPKAKERIKHFTKGYHDERRAREKAERERQAAEEMALVAMDQLKTMQGQLQATHTTARTATQAQLQSRLEAAKKAYRDAYEAGDADALEKANDEIMQARIDMEKVRNIPENVAPPLQIDRDEIYKRYEAPAEQPAADDKALAWHSENPWFGQDLDMTQTAHAIHNRLVKAGVNPDKEPEKYYGELNSRLRNTFPDYDWGETVVEAPVEQTPAPSRAKPASVVAPATRSTAPRKITLTASEVQVARRLGVSLEEYARNKAELQKRGQL